MKQRGFSLIEGLLILLVVAALGYGGYYVWNQSKDSDVEEVVELETTQQVSSDNNIGEDVETTHDNNESKRKTFTAYDVTLTIDDIDGWEYMGIYGYGGESSNEYFIDISNKSRDIQLSLQITTFESSFYEQDIFDTFTGFNGETYYITKSSDDQPGDMRYQQMGISACDNGHCVTKLNQEYNLNANITPIVQNTDFDGSLDNIEEVKKLFSSISIQ